MECLEEDEILAGLFLDLSKAFDCVSHEILLTELEIYEIRVIELLKYYLSNKKQIIVLDSEESRYESSENAFIHYRS